MNPNVSADSLTRRQAIAGIALALGTLAGSTRAFGDTEPAAKTAPDSAPKPARPALHYEADYKVRPQRIYKVLLDSQQFVALTGRPAKIDPTAGGSFSLFGGLILGRNIELVPFQRIVQAWRPAHWDPGVYSIVKFEFQDQGDVTRMLLDHKGFPEAEAAGLDSGWKEHYLEPLARFLA